MADALTNFSYSTVATAPSPATSGTSLVVQAGDGAKFPPVPFNVVVWATGANPLTTNSEIVRVTAISTDTLTITRQAEGSANRSIVVGDQIGPTITAQFLGLGLVNRRPGFDVNIPDGHSVVVSDDYEIAAAVETVIQADAVLEIL